MRPTEEELLKANRAMAAKHNPTLEKLINDYVEASGDTEFLAYMQDVVDGYMMHECKLGRLPFTQRS